MPHPPVPTDTDTLALVPAPPEIVTGVAVVYPCPPLPRVSSASEPVVANVAVRAAPVPPTVAVGAAV